MSAPNDDDRARSPEEDAEGATNSAHAADVAWLAARERGEQALPPLDSQRAAAYEKLQGLVAALPDEPVPPAWNDDVLAAIRAGQQPQLMEISKPAVTTATSTAGEPISLADRRITTRSPLARRMKLAAAGVIAAAAVLAIWMVSRSPRPAPRGLTVSVLHYEGKRASVVVGEAALGDVIVVEASTADIDELRIYRDDQEVVLRCPAPSIADAATCERKPGVIVSRLRLTAPGRYRAVGLSPAPTKPSSGNLATDLADCHCQPHTTPPIVAR